MNPGFFRGPAEALAMLWRPVPIARTSQSWPNSLALNSSRFNGNQHYRSHPQEILEPVIFRSIFNLLAWELLSCISANGLKKSWNKHELVNLKFIIKHRLFRYISSNSQQLKLTGVDPNMPNSLVSGGVNNQSIS